MAQIVPGVGERWSTLTDAVFVGALTMVALLGLREVFGGTRWLLSGAVGVACGLLVAYICVLTRQWAAVVCALAVGVAVLASGLVFPDRTVGFVPNTRTAQAVLSGGLRGWKDILAVLPPVGDTGDLAAVPFAGAMAAAVLGFSIARRTTRPGGAVVPPLLLMVAVSLIGTARPEGIGPRGLAAQGFGFAVITVVWAAVRQQRALARGGRRLATRPFGVVLTLTCSALVMVVAGPQLAPGGEVDRTVLRAQVVPPFDLTSQGSPLAGFRRFTNDPQEVLFTVDGLSSGTRIRQAVMDDYDGLVWNVGGRSEGTGTGSGWFQREGEPSAADSTRTSTVTMGTLGGVWVPAVGTGEAVTVSADGGDLPLFTTAEGPSLAVSGVLAPGTHVVEGISGRVGVGLDDLSAQARLAGPAQPVPQHVPAAVAERAVRITADAGTPVNQILAIARALRQGYYSNGQPGQSPSESGHSAARITAMLEAEELNGDEEQYTALAALMLRSLNIPARVALGWGITAQHQEVHGSDTTAWVEIPFEGYGWVAVDVTPDHDRALSSRRPAPKPRADVPNDPVPPPAPQAAQVRPRVSEREASDEPEPRGLPWARILLWGTGTLGVLCLLTAPVWSLMLAKWHRRRRRRRRGGGADRIAGGWRELVDLSTDLGRRSSIGATRREQAEVMDLPGVEPLARTADAATFGPRGADPDEAEQFWDEVLAIRSEQLAGLSGARRWRVVLSPASLHRPGPFRRPQLRWPSTRRAAGRTWT